jgi:serine phosphatase RsbU (regulator of sigma subunit)
MASQQTQAEFLLNLENVDWYACYHSACHGGDFFDGLAVGDRLLFLLTDVAGERLNAAEVMQQAQEAFRRNARTLFAGGDVNESDALAELAHAVNVALVEAAGGVRFSPTFLGCFNAALGILTYCNGGNLLALFREAAGVRVLEASAMPLGLFTHLTFEAVVLAFQPGDALLITTKGVAESKKGREEFGVARAVEFFTHTGKMSAAEICTEVLRQAYEFASPPRWYLLEKPAAQEDLTALALIRS